MATFCSRLSEQRREGMSRITRQCNLIASGWTKSVSERERLMFIVGGWGCRTSNKAVGSFSASGAVHSNHDRTPASWQTAPSIRIINTGTSRAGPRIGGDFRLSDQPPRRAPLADLRERRKHVDHGIASHGGQSATHGATKSPSLQNSQSQSSLPISHKYDRIIIQNHYLDFVLEIKKYLRHFRASLF